MALYPCPECRKEISDQANVCPHCGVKLKSGPLGLIFKIIGGLLGILVLSFIAWYLITPEYKQEAIGMRRTCLEIVKTTGQSRLYSECERQYDIAISHGMSANSTTTTAQVYSTEKSNWEAGQQKETEKVKKTCNEKIRKIKMEYKELKDKGEWYKAGLKVWRCAELTGNIEYIRLAAEATSNAK